MLIGLVGTESRVAAAAPPVTVTLNQTSGQSDPTNASPILFDVVFSEAVTGFTFSDVFYTGSTAGGTLTCTVSGSGPAYVISVTGMTTSGTVIPSLPSGAAASVATGTLSQASTSTDHTVTWDVTAPTVTVNKAAGQADPTAAGDSFVLFTAVFSEPVVGFTSSDILLSASTCGGTLSASITGTGPTYTITVSGMAAPAGNVVCSIPASGVTDLAGNLNTASTHTDNIVAWTAPAGAWYTLYTQSLTTDSNGWQNYSVGQYVAPAAYDAGAPATGTKLRITMRTASTVGVGFFDSWIAHTGAPTNDLLDYDGTQVQVKWGGSASGTTAAATSRVSDDITYAFNKTKGLAFRMSFNGASNIARLDGTGANFQRSYAADGDWNWPPVTNAGPFDGTAWDTMANGIYLIEKIEVFG